MAKRVGKYELGRTLGEGTFGKVKHAVNVETNEPVAIKILDKDKIQKQNMGAQIKKEISIMKIVRHPYIVTMREVLASKTKIFIVLDLVTGGELFEKIVDEGKLSQEAALFYFRQIVEGVGYCHQKGVCHRDLKPENLLLDSEGNIKISDFGLSSLYVGDAESDGASRTELLHTTCGTPNYVAPEVLDDSGYDGKKADVWSIGVILYVLVAGFLPFDEKSLVNLFAKIKNADFTYPSWFSTELKSLLELILVADPTKRITLSEMRKNPLVWTEEMAVAEKAAAAEEAVVATTTGSDGATESEGAETADNGSTAGAAAAAAAVNSVEGTVEDDAEGDDEFRNGGPQSRLRQQKSWRVLPSSARESRCLNAFDLVNLCGGFALDRLFVSPDGPDVGACTGRRHATLHQISAKPANELVAAISEIMQSVGYEVEVVGGAKIKASFASSAGTIGIWVYAYVLTDKLCLAEFRRGKGDILGFRKMYTDLVETHLKSLFV
jgi:5'-AMP-activated protein kinase catalytic alpha subunit